MDKHTYDCSRSAAAGTCLDERLYVASDLLLSVSLDIAWPRGTIEASQVRNNDMKAGCCQGGNLLFPAVPELRESVQEDNLQRATSALLQARKPAFEGHSTVQLWQFTCARCTSRAALTTPEGMPTSTRRSHDELAYYNESTTLKYRTSSESAALE